MDINDENIIKAYLDGTLDGATRRAVEEKIANDQAFAAEVDLEREIIEGLQLNEQEGLREGVRGFQEQLEQEGFFTAIFEELRNEETTENKEPETKDKGRLKRYWGVWLGLFLLVLVIILYYLLVMMNRESGLEGEGDDFLGEVEQLDEQPDSPESDLQEGNLLGDLLTDNIGDARSADFDEDTLDYRAFFKPPPRFMEDAFAPRRNKEANLTILTADSVVFADSSSSEPVPDPLDIFFSGMNLYNAADYPKAIRELNNYLTANDGNRLYRQEAKLYIGISFMALSRHTQAIQVLQNLHQEDPREILTDVRWYLALSYLENNDYEAATTFLRGLQGGRKYGEEATEILESMGIRLDLN